MLYLAKQSAISMSLGTVAVVLFMEFGLMTVVVAALCSAVIIAPLWSARSAK
jgi:hypothetical protein